MLGLYHMKNFNWAIVAVVIAIISIFISVNAKTNASQSSVADQVISKGTIRLGYIPYPPLLFKEEATGKLSGVSYDLVEAAAKKLDLKTEWVEEVGWGGAIEGLKTKRYDMVGTQMWPNSARAREAVFSDAPMNSVVYPYVKSGDNRFSEGLSNLNSSKYTIGVLDGEMAAFIAKDDYPNAKTNALPQLSSYAEVFLNVTSGKADIAFAELSTANDFLKSNPGKIEKVGNTPLRVLGNTFVFARGQDSMVAMWNVALHEIESDGTVLKILKKYGVDKDYILNQ